MELPIKNFKIQDNQLEKILPGIRKNISLKKYTTFRIGGRAKYLYLADSRSRLIKAIKAAKQFDLPFFILGKGSNVLISDRGLNGLVIIIQGSIFKMAGLNLWTESGVLLSTLMRFCLSKGRTGLEWAAGIPGTIGGAIYGNAGAYGRSMGDVVKEVEVFDTNTERIKVFKKQDCRFGYRDSVFKKKKNLIILSCLLQLKQGDRRQIKREIKNNLEKKKLTQPLSYPSAGSIFKNPPGVSAAELIKMSGLKGKQIGDVKISEKHANFIVNLGEGTASDARKLISLVKAKVKSRFGVNLEEEIQFLGFISD